MLYLIHIQHHEYWLDNTTGGGHCFCCKSQTLIQCVTNKQKIPRKPDPGIFLTIASSLSNNPFCDMQLCHQYFLILSRIRGVGARSQHTKRVSAFFPTESESRKCRELQRRGFLMLSSLLGWNWQKVWTGPGLVLALLNAFPAQVQSPNHVGFVHS